MMWNKGIGDRLLLIVLTPFVMLVVGTLIAGTYGFDPDTVAEMIIKAVALEILCTFALFVFLGFILGIFASSWLEGIIEKQAMRVSLLCGVIMAMVIAGLLFYISE